MTVIALTEWMSLVTGTVASVGRRGGHLIVGFRTDSVPPIIGATFAVVTVCGAAERLPAAVLLNDCVVP